jgi:O-antigen/teichoic acid export membrane protein
VGAVSAAPSRERVARAVSWVGVGHVSSQLLWLGSLLVLATLVPPKAFGSIATGMVLVNLAGLLVDSGTRGSLVQARELGRAEVRGAVALNLAAGAGATAIIAALAGPITSTFAQGGEADVIRAMSLGVVLYAAGITPLALLQKHLRFKHYAGASIAAATISAVLALAAGLAGAGVWALVVRQLASMGLLSVFAWAFAHDLVPRAKRAAGERVWALRQPGWAGFFLLALTDFVALNADFLVVGHIDEATGLGLYSLAFTLAFAPLTQVSWQVGRVLFPAAAATEDRETVARRTVVSLRLLALLLAPLAIPAVVLAPEVLPGLLGEEWEPMVAPFQILVVVGVGHALVGMVGESLSGTGNIGFRARVNAVWALSMVGLLIWLVSVDGIRGAALAHLILFVPFAAAYLTAGARRIGLGPRRIAAGLAPVAGAVAVQAAATAAVGLGLDAAGADGLAAALAAALAGLAAAGAVLARGPSSPLAEGRAVVASALRRPERGGAPTPAA